MLRCYQLSGLHWAYTCATSDSNVRRVTDCLDDPLHCLRRTRHIVFVPMQASAHRIALVAGAIDARSA